MFGLKKLLINESASLRPEESRSEESVPEHIDHKFTEKIVDVVNSYINHFSKFKESTYIISASSPVIKAVIKNTKIFYVLRIENYVLENAPKNWKNIENGHNYQVFLIPS